MSDKKDLLIEIGTEELPPKALKKLSAAFTDGILEGLKNASLQFGATQSFAAPRRLAVLIRDVDSTQPDQDIERKGPAVKAAFNAEGNPTKAVLGFAKSCGVEVEQLERIETPKGEWLVYRTRKAGQPTCELVPEIVSDSLARLPVPKRMRWGDLDNEFVRPVHWIVMLHGSDIIDAEVLGIKAGNETRGHRFHHPEPIKLAQAGEYADALLQQGHVIADFEARKNVIETQTHDVASDLKARALIDPDLLDEVTALVEWPVAVAGSFEERFLEVPQESLISSMQEHQKFFPLTDDKGDLLPKFITIANIDSKDISQVREGNERVIRPRLSDAAFFWEQDCKVSLEKMREKLRTIIYQTKLGSIHDKTERMAEIAHQVAEFIDESQAKAASRAAALSKSDLVSNMVYEFPELQGIMGKYYARVQNESDAVATAIDEQYMPRFAGDELPATVAGQAVSIADKLDTLVGIFGIGMTPTGDKDPFALRRAALGVLRILIEKEIDLDLSEALQFTASRFGKLIELGTEQNVLQFMIERLRAYYHEKNISTELYEAVAAVQPVSPLDFHQRIMAVKAFSESPAAESLAAANKRISNILKKQETHPADIIDSSLLEEDAEKQLYDSLLHLSGQANQLITQRKYAEALTVLSELREPVDRFFDDVMVMTDNDIVRNNRLALLNLLRNQFLSIADISRLQ